MALVYKTGLQGIREAIDILRDPDPNLISRTAPIGEIADDKVMVFTTEGNIDSPYWRFDDKQWFQLRCNYYPKNGAIKEWKAVYYRLRHLGVPVDFYRKEYTDAGATFDPHKTGWKHNFVVCHFTGKFNYASALPQKHSNTKEIDRRSAAIKAVDLTTRNSPLKRSVRYADADNTTPHKEKYHRKLSRQSSPSNSDQVSATHKMPNLPVLNLFGDTGTVSEIPHKNAIIKPKTMLDNDADTSVGSNECDLEIHNLGQVDNSIDHNYFTPTNSTVPPDEAFGHAFSKNRAHIPTDTHVLKELKKKAEKGMKPAAMYRSSLLQQSLSNEGDRPSKTPRNLKQAQNVSYAVHKVQRHDDLYSLYAFAFDRPGFLQAFTLVPVLAVTCGHDEMFKHFRSFHQNSDRVVVHYDTKYEDGPFYLSTLAFRESIFHTNPTIPIAYFIHQYTDEESHAEFFRTMLRHIPELNSSKTIIVTDREDSIRNVVKQYMPAATNLLCWWHIARNIRRWCTKTYNGRIAGAYVSQITDLLHCKSMAEFHEKLELYRSSWDQRFVRYYYDHQNDDFVSSARWVLESLGLYNPMSGITSNASESINAVVSRIFTKEDAMITVAVNSLYFLQVHHLLDIRRGILGEVGDLNLKSGVPVGRIYIPENFQDIVDRNIIESMLIDGEIPDNLNVVEKRKLPPLREMNHANGLGKLLLMKDRVQLVTAKGVFLIRGFNNQTFKVDLKQKSCTCKRGGQCEHLVAALMSVNLTSAYILPKSNPTGMGGIYRAMCSRTTGKKGPTRSRVRNPIAWDTDSPPEASEVLELPSDEGLQDRGDVPEQLGFRGQIAEQINHPPNFFQNRILNSKKMHDNPVAATRPISLSSIPRITQENVSTDIIVTDAGRIKLVDIATLKTKLTKQEILCIDKYVYLREQRRFTQVDVGCLSDIVVMEYIRILCNLYAAIVLEPWEVVYALDGLNLQNEGDDDTPPDILTPTAGNTKRWRQNGEAFLVYAHNFNHYIAIHVSAREKEIRVFDPLGAFQMDDRRLNRLSTVLNSVLQFPQSTPWVVVYPIAAVQIDGRSCGVFCCYYLRSILMKDDMTQNFDVERYRTHILKVITQQCDVFNMTAIEVCQVCRKIDPPEEDSISDTDTAWIHCVRCERRSHFACVNVQDKNNFQCL